MDLRAGSPDKRRCLVPLVNLTSEWLGASLAATPFWHLSCTTRATSMPCSIAQPTHSEDAKFAPNHCKRDCSQWADDLTHLDLIGFTPDRRLSLVFSFAALFQFSPQIFLDWRSPWRLRGRIYRFPPNPPRIS